MVNGETYSHHAAIRLDFIEARPKGRIEVKLKVDDESLEGRIVVKSRPEDSSGKEGDVRHIGEHSVERQ